MSTSATLPPGSINPSDVTIDMSTAKPIPPAGYTIDPSDVTIDMSTAKPIPPAGYTLEPPKDEASETRQMLVSGLTGMPTPNMTATDRQNFTTGKAVGAVSVPAVAAGTLGAGLAGEFGPPVIKAVADMAKAHPVAAKAIAKIIGGAVLGHDYGHTLKGALIGALLSAGK